jgi:uncharacterized protein YdeI (YjbR/CyaY-like superfamily)
MEPRFFESPEEFRKWLERHHGTEKELLVGFRRRGSGLPSMTWPESVDEALCFGWIDGLRKSLDEASYTIRFTPRKASSAWSAINLKRVPELIEQGRMKPAGLKAWENRIHSRHSGYSYDGPDWQMGAAEEAELKANQEAWAFFQSQAPWYRKLVSHWVMSAKRPETKEKRLRQLIKDSEEGRRIERTTKYSKKPT